MTNSKAYNAMLCKKLSPEASDEDVEKFKNLTILEQLTIIKSLRCAPPEEEEDDEGDDSLARKLGCVS